jgi:hypothetical protein
MSDQNDLEQNLDANTLTRLSIRDYILIYSLRYWQAIIVLIIGLGGVVALIWKRLASVYSSAVALLITYPELTFSALLVLLYFMQYRTQRQQYLLTELQQHPDVIIEEYDYDGDTLNLKLSNHGNGAARQLELISEVDFHTDQEQLQPNIVSTPLKQSFDATNGGTQSLPAHITHESFEVNPLIDVLMNSEPAEFSSVMDVLSQAGIERIQFQLYIRYKSQISEQRERPIVQGIRRKKETKMVLSRPCEVEIEKDLNLEQALRQGRLIGEKEYGGSFS